MVTYAGQLSQGDITIRFFNTPESDAFYPEWEFAVAEDVYTAIVGGKDWAKAQTVWPFYQNSVFRCIKFPGADAEVKIMGVDADAIALILKEHSTTVSMDGQPRAHLSEAAVAAGEAVIERLRKNEPVRPFGSRKRKAAAAADEERKSPAKKPRDGLLSAAAWSTPVQFHLSGSLAAVVRTFMVGTTRYAAAGDMQLAAGGFNRGDWAVWTKALPDGERVHATGLQSGRYLVGISAAGMNTFLHMGLADDKRGSAMVALIRVLLSEFGSAAPKPAA